MDQVHPFSHFFSNLVDYIFHHCRAEKSFNFLCPCLRVLFKLQICLKKDKLNPRLSSSQIQYLFVIYFQRNFTVINKCTIYVPNNNIFSNETFPVQKIVIEISQTLRKWRAEFMSNILGGKKLMSLKKMAHIGHLLSKNIAIPIEN